MRKDPFAFLKQGAKFATSCAVIVILAAIGNSAARPQQSNTPDSAIERGHKQFGQACGFCHGADGTGGRGPDLVRSPLVAHDVKGDLIGNVIRQGRPDKGMPAMPLTDAQVSDIAAFLHARAAAALSSSGLPEAYPVEKLLTGNSDAGKAFFNGAGGCNGCHSPTTDLNGVASKYSPIDLEAHMLYPGGRHTIATVTLPSGEQIKGPLVHADDFVVSLRDSSGWYRSFSRDGVKIELQDALAAHRELLGKLTQSDVHNLFAYLETLK
ncbi:MAG TPA: c-type cytochrome [Candidatus Acidoferrum sp.]|nr:c-type cytochrome [Candidatus Acidoferrum sp.]